MFEGEGGLLAVAQSYNKFGLHFQDNGEIHYREWAPSANALSIVSVFHSSLALEKSKNRQT